MKPKLHKFTFFLDKGLGVLYKFQDTTDYEFQRSAFMRVVLSNQRFIKRHQVIEGSKRINDTLAELVDYTNQGRYEPTPENIKAAGLEGVI